VDVSTIAGTAVKASFSTPPPVGFHTALIRPDVGAVGAGGDATAVTPVWSK
jgi:hypothetical protein